jgi:hypothetical protein
MPFEKQFRIVSYLAVFFGFIALWVSGTFGIFETGLFICVLILAWNLEDSKWQISERVGTTLVVLALPVFFGLFYLRIFDFANRETMLPGLLGRLILSLAGIKILQHKSDRDWMFLYLMAFFEVLLAAGLSISIGYIAAFGAFIFVMACTIVLFQIRKASRITLENSTAVHKTAVTDETDVLPMRRVFFAAGVLIVLISVLAVPMFFILPRVSGAGLGGLTDSVSAISGFSDSVRLGGIGRIQQNDAIVMRVRIENEAPKDIHWRGVALDTFDGLYWSRSKTALREPRTKNERDLIQVDSAKRQDGMTLQTVYLEPIDTPVIFGLYRMVGVQGNFPVLYRDAAGSITFQRTGERVSYKVLSDSVTPDESILRSDRASYSADETNYLQLPRNLDSRIKDLADRVTEDSNNRYDAAVAIENYLQSQYGYTLEQKASGDDPLSDFLFDVREGHCEYFATAMAMMLRTQGIATRVVNGFQRGDYNDTADVYVVRQRHAHSWVEVYFPESDSWVAFDPTPAAGQFSSDAFAGITDQVRKYMEALETFWIQYFIAFDNQEQRSLFVSVRNGFNQYQTGLSSGWDALKSELSDWWRSIRGDDGIEESVTSVIKAIAFLASAIVLTLLFVWSCRKAIKLKVWRSLWNRLFAHPNASAIEFYQRMQEILADKGFVRLPHQTPLEFAAAVGISEAVSITDEYNRIRFGGEHLSEKSAFEVENWLSRIQAL